MPDAPRARPWLRPPALRTPADGEGEERHASWLELFFDLVFVVAIAQLAQELVRDHSLGGFAIFAGLFLPVFIAWQGFTFYADRFDSDDVLFRAVMLAAMLAIAALAVQIPDVAAGRHDAGFVVAYVTLRSLLVALYLRAWPHAVAARPLIARYAGGYSLSIALWLLSLLVDPPLRYVLWGVGLAIEYAMPVVAQRIHAGSRWTPATFRSASRLFTIIVLGESVVAVALGTADEDWRVASALTAALGFVSVACLWWVYFDRGMAGGLSSRTGSMQIYTRIHIPLLAALTAVGAGVHMLIQEAATGRRAGRGRLGARRRRGALPAVPHRRPARHRPRCRRAGGAGAGRPRARRPRRAGGGADAGEPRGVLGGGARRARRLRDPARTGRAGRLGRELRDRLEQAIDVVAVVVGDDAGAQGAVGLEAQPARELQGVVVAVPDGDLGARQVGGDVARAMPGRR